MENDRCVSGKENIYAFLFNAFVLKKCLVPRKFTKLWNIVVELRSPPTSVKWRMTEKISNTVCQNTSKTNCKTYPGTVMIDK